MKTRLIGYLLGISLCLGMTGYLGPRGAPIHLPTSSPGETLLLMQTVTPFPRSSPTATSRPTATALPPATRTRIPPSATRTAYPTNPPTLPAAQRNVLLDFAWFPDGKRFAVYTNRGIFFYETAGLAKTEFKMFGNRDYLYGSRKYKVGAVAISQDGATIATSSKSAGSDVDFWDVRTGEWLKKLYSGLDGFSVVRLEFSPDGKALFVHSIYPHSDGCESAEDNFALHILSRMGSVFETDILGRRQCSIAPSKYRFTRDGKFYLFQTSMGEYYYVTSVNYNNPVTIKSDVYLYSDGEILDASPDGSVLAKRRPDFTTELLDTKSNKPLPPKFRAWVRFLDGTKQFLVNEGKDWGLWRNGKTVCNYAGVSGSPRWKFSANGKFFADLTYEENVQIWRVDDCQMLASLSFDRYYP